MKLKICSFLCSMLLANNLCLADNSLPRLRFPLSVSLQSFDPTEAEDFITIRILMNLGQGLMTFDKNLKAQNGLAESYKVSKDQKTYTFKLKRAKWSDGHLITSRDFIRGFQRTLSPNTAAKISQNFQDLVVGARDYKSKKITDFSQVGIKALNEQTLEFKLNHPAAYFLSLLTLPFCYPQTEQSLIKENTPTSGAYFISELKEQSKIILKPNDYFEPKAKNEVELKVVTDSAALVNLYEKNEIDVLEKIPSHDFERLKNSKELMTAPFLATYYLGFEQTKKPFDQISVRKTIASAIQREEIQKILKDPQIISSSWVPTPLPTSNLKFNFKLSDAEKKEALEVLKKENLQLVFDTQEKNTLITSLVQQQLKKNLQLELQLKGFEWKSYIKLLTTERPSFFRFAWLAAFPDPLSHLNVFTSNNPNNYTGYKNADYDQLVKKISEMNASNKRDALIVKAQKKLLEEDVVIVPLYHYQQFTLVKKDWKGLDLTPMGLLHFYRANRAHVP